MKTDFYWIAGPWPGRLAILPRPRGGDWLAEEIDSWQQARVNVVVSLLIADEIADFDLTAEARLCEANGVQFFSFPIVDRGVPPSATSAADFVKRLEDLLAQGKTVGCHCRQGVGRSALIAAALLTSTGLSPEAAFQRVSAARGCPVPETAEPRQWV